MKLRHTFAEIAANGTGSLAGDAGTGLAEKAEDLAGAGLLGRVVVLGNYLLESADVGLLALDVARRHGQQQIVAGLEGIVPDELVAVRARHGVGPRVIAGLELGVGGVVLAVLLAFLGRQFGGVGGVVGEALELGAGVLAAEELGVFLGLGRAAQFLIDEVLVIPAFGFAAGTGVLVIEGVEGLQCLLVVPDAFAVFLAEGEVGLGEFEAGGRLGGLRGGNVAEQVVDLVVRDHGGLGVVAARSDVALVGEVNGPVTEAPVVLQGAVSPAAAEIALAALHLLWLVGPKGAVGDDLGSTDVVIRHGVDGAGGGGAAALEERGGPLAALVFGEQADAEDAVLGLDRFEGADGGGELLAAGLEVGVGRVVAGRDGQRRVVVEFGLAVVTVSVGEVSQEVVGLAALEGAGAGIFEGAAQEFSSLLFVTIPQGEDGGAAEDLGDVVDVLLFLGHLFQAGDGFAGRTAAGEEIVLGQADAGADLQVVARAGGDGAFEGLGGPTAVVQFLVELAGDEVVAGLLVAVGGHLGGFFEVGDGFLQTVLLEVEVGLDGHGLAADVGIGTAVGAQVLQNKVRPVEVIALDVGPGQPEADLLVGGAVADDVAAGLLAVGLPHPGRVGVIEDGDHADGAEVLHQVVLLRLVLDHYAGGRIAGRPNAALAVLDALLARPVPFLLLALTFLLPFSLELLAFLLSGFFGAKAFALGLLGVSLDFTLGDEFLLLGLVGGGGALHLFLLGAGAELVHGEAEGPLGGLVVLLDELGLPDEEVTVVHPVGIGMFLNDDGDLFDGVVQVFLYDGDIVHGQEGEHFQAFGEVVDVLGLEGKQGLRHQLIRVEVAVVVGVGVVPELAQGALVVAALRRSAGRQQDLRYEQQAEESE